MSAAALLILYVFKNKLTRYQFLGNIAVLAAVVVTILLSKTIIIVPLQLGIYLTDCLVSHTRDLL